MAARALSACSISMRTAWERLSMPGVVAVMRSRACMWVGFTMTCSGTLRAWVGMG